MEIDFDNIQEHVIPMDDFLLKWRFTDKDYNQLPREELDRLKPLDVDASKFLWDFIVKSNLHAEIPFKKDFFEKVDLIKIVEGNDNEVQGWLSNCGLPLTRNVYLSWQPGIALIAPLELLIKYFDDFHYLQSDDLTVFDPNLNWALLFFHEGRIYFGSNMDSD